MTEGETAIDQPAVEPADAPVEAADAPVKAAEAAVKSAAVKTASAVKTSASASAVEGLRRRDSGTREPQRQGGTRDQFSKHGTTSR
jgi:hypothetical protein